MSGGKAVPCQIRTCEIVPSCRSQVALASLLTRNYCNKPDRRTGADSPKLQKQLNSWSIKFSEITERPRNALRSSLFALTPALSCSHCCTDTNTFTKPQQLSPEVRCSEGLSLTNAIAPEYFGRLRNA